MFLVVILCLITLIALIVPTKAFNQLFAYVHRELDKPPADYLPPMTAVANGMPPNTDIAVIVGVDSGELAASGYRLYVFYP